MNESGGGVKKKSYLDNVKSRNYCLYDITALTQTSDIAVEERLLVCSPINLAITWYFKE